MSKETAHLISGVSFALAFGLLLLNLLISAVTVRMRAKDAAVAGLLFMLAFACLAVADHFAKVGKGAL